MKPGTVTHQAGLSRGSAPALHLACLSAGNMHPAATINSPVYYVQWMMHEAHSPTYIESVAARMSIMNPRAYSSTRAQIPTGYNITQALCVAQASPLLGMLHEAPSPAFSAPLSLSVERWFVKLCSTPSRSSSQCLHQVALSVSGAVTWLSTHSTQTCWPNGLYLAQPPAA